MIYSTLQHLKFFRAWRLSSCLLVLSVLLSPRLASQCALICNDQLFVELGSDGTVTIPFADVLVGEENCSGNVFGISLNNNVSNAAPTLTLNSTGTVQVHGFATAPNGVTNLCWGNITVAATGACSPDVTPPAAVCKDISRPIGPNGQAVVYPTSINNGSTDLCSGVTLQISTGSGAPGASVAFGTVGTYTAVLWITDESGNSNSCFSNVTVTSGNPCSPDVTAPLTVCNSALSVPVNPSTQTANVSASALNAGSNDNCTAAQDLLLRVSLSPNGPPPTTTSLTLTGIGTTTVVLWVGDAAGNWNKCWTEVTTVAAQCNPDQLAPVVVAPADVTISNVELAALALDFGNDAQMNTAFGTAQASDLCDPNPLIINTYYLENWQDGSVKKIIRSFGAFDQAGNLASAQQVVYVFNDYTIHCPAWYFPGNATTDSLSITPVNASLVSAWSDQVFNANCVDNSLVRIERTWSVINWQEGNGSETPFALPALDLNNDGQTGDPYDLVVLADSAYVLINGTPGFAVGPRAPLYQYLQHLRYNYNDTIGTPLALIAPANLTISTSELAALNLNYNDNAQLDAAFGAAQVTGGCGNVTFLQTYHLELWFGGGVKRILRDFFVTDQSGNTSTGAQIISVFHDYTIHCPAWGFPGNPSSDSLTVVAGAALLSTNWSDQIFTAPCDHSLVRVERTWGVFNWQEINVEDVAFNLPALDLNNDGQVGDAYDALVSDDSIYVLVNGLPAQAVGPRAPFYQYLQNKRYNYGDTSNLTLSGLVYLDTLANCTHNPGEQALVGWKVKAIGQSGVIYSGLTSTNGYYQIFICPEDSVVEVSLDVPINYAGNCPFTYAVTLPPGGSATQDIPVQLNNTCRALGVDLSTLAIRPCMPGQYNVSYCNYSTQLVADTYVDVALDSLLTLQGISVPFEDLSANSYRIQTGDLAAGECRTFYVGFVTDCNAPVGLTFCSEAHIYPVDDCPGVAPWAGANLRATSVCDGDSVRLKIQNIGVGDMQNALEFIVTEDLIMYMSQPFQLQSGDSKVVAAPANGATWRMEAPQENGHPWGGWAATAIEGCGGVNTLGLVNQMPLNSPNPFEAVDCRVSTSSFDPNDKQAFPTGYSDEHYLRANTDLEYLIRFQNTGTDTAFTVVLLDSLSTYLDAASVRPGAGSHAYDFDLLPGNVLRFRFDGILLPDSSTNEPLSHGYVKFRVAQQPDNPNGTLIENFSDIYFDVNAPVRTNTTYHLIGDNFIAVSTDQPQGSHSPLRVYPNPAADWVNFELPAQQQSGAFTLTDLSGRVVRQQNFSGNTFRFDREKTPDGVYLFSIQAANGERYTGKLMLQ